MQLWRHARGVILSLYSTRSDHELLLCKVFPSNIKSAAVLAERYVVLHHATQNAKPSQRCKADGSCLHPPPGILHGGIFTVADVGLDSGCSRAGLSKGSRKSFDLVVLF